MNNHTHARAQQLIRKGWLDDLSSSETRWLREHLAICAGCARTAESTQAVISALRSVPSTADPALVERTRGQVMWRAQELREARERTWTLVVACAASFISGGITLPLLWQLFAWLGQEISLGEPVWQAGFLVFVLLPGVLAAIVLLTRRRAADFINLTGAGE